jgi:hypothetical protein
MATNKRHREPLLQCGGWQCAEALQMALEVMKMQVRGGIDDEGL